MCSIWLITMGTLGVQSDRGRLHLLFDRGCGS